MNREEAAFIDAIYASPEDEVPRLIYSDWLDERGDARGSYLRAELEHHRNSPGRSEWDDQLAAMREGLDKVWVATVSRSPFGILVPGLTFTDMGPKVTQAFLTKLEKRWGEPVPPDYAAFLLRYNGGRPSKPYIWSYANYPEGTSHYFDEVRFFSTLDKSPGGRPYLLLSVVDLFDGNVADGQDEERLARLMPIGTVAYEEGWQNILALLMDQTEEFETIIEVEYSDEEGVCEASDDCLTKASFLHLLMELCDRTED
jgi:uncharacterized protein (TIGR02996 family)